MYFYRFVVILLVKDMPNIQLSSDKTHDHSTTVLFCCPKDGLKVEERFLIYRLRFDGIACSRYSVKNNTNYQLSLEIVNVKEHYKNNPKMMCLGLLFQKDDFSAVKDYLHRVMVLGLNGVWIKTKEGNEEKWYHWKWFIGSIPCDTVLKSNSLESLIRSSPIILFFIAMDANYVIALFTIVFNQFLMAIYLSHTKSIAD